MIHKRKKKGFFKRKRVIKRWEIIACLKGMGLGVLLAFLVYDSLLGVFLLLPYAPIYYKREKKKQEKKEMEALKVEFSQVIKLITRGLELGHSLEHCVKEAKDEYSVIVEERQTPMTKYLQSFTKKLEMNVSIQEVLQQFAKESKLVEEHHFADVVAIARQSGGNLPEILRNTSKVMLEKEQVQEEIITMMSAKQMEQKVMTCMPVGILFYMRVTSGDYMKPLYGNWMGVIVATIGVLLMGVSIWWAEKIVDISI